MTTQILTVKFKVLGRAWRIRLLSKKRYKRKHGKDSVAMCRGWKRIIDLSPLGFDLETITHEVLHAYLYETCAKQTIESEDGLEEFFCEIIARRGYEILALTKRLRREVCLLTS